MRRLFVLTICVALFTALALPASANSGTGPPPIPTCGPGLGPCQETDHFGQLTFLGSPLPGCTGIFTEWVFIQQTGNGVQHINVNSAQDFWVTTTMVGPMTLVVGTVLLDSNGNPILDANGNPIFTQDPSKPTFTGMLQQWFGASFNNKNFSNSGTINLQATGSDGSHIAVHASTHINTTGMQPFIPNLNSAHFDVKCTA
ncbi:MAG TPA: hypothetical protein VF990_04745 [Candidatus Dormibacteraeota bacterium]